MMSRKTFTVVATLALAGCLAAVPLLGCQNGSVTSQEASVAQNAVPASEKPDESAGDASQTSAPALQSTSPTTIPAEFFDILGISQGGAQDFLESLGATDIDAQEDGSYVVNLSGDDFTAFVSHAYQAIQDKIKSSTTDGTYTDVSSVDYDETFATVVVVLGSKEIPEQDAALAQNLGHAANVYQQVAGLPVSCDVIVMNSEGDQLAEVVSPDAGSAAKAKE